MLSIKGMFIREMLVMMKSAGIPITIEFTTSPVGNENIKVFNCRVDMVYDTEFIIVDSRGSKVGCYIEQVKGIAVDFSKQ